MTTPSLLSKFKFFTKRDLLVTEKLLSIRDKRVEFATQYHRNTRGDRMDFVHNPYLPQIYNSLARTIVLQGSVQSKKSEFIIIDHLAMAACGMSVFFVLPKIELRTSYVQNRIDKRISEIPEYQGFINAGFFDNTVLKSFGKGVIKYVGSNVITDFKEFPGDAIIIEEVDQCTQGNLVYGTDRLRGSIFQIKRFVGNPTVKGYGINKAFDKSSQNLWFIPCPSCKEFTKLDWFETVMDIRFDDDGNPVDFSLKDSEWKPGCGRDIYCVCPKCGHPLERATPDGMWIPQNSNSLDEGYLLTMLLSWENSVEDMFESWTDSWENTNGMQHFWNSVLGLPYALGSSRITVQTLRKAAALTEPYVFSIKKDSGCIIEDCSRKKCSMGIDVGKKFDVRISEVEDGVRRAVFIGKVATREELINLGRRYNVYCAVIDSMPEYRVVQDLQDEAPFFVWACRYDSEGKDKKMRRDKKTRTIYVDRTVALDRSMNEFRAGRNQLPKNFESLLDGEFVKEMTDPIRQEELDRNGNIKMVWSKCKDHQRHCDVYDFLASEFCSSSALSGISVG